MRGHIWRFLCCLKKRLDAMSFEYEGMNRLKRQMEKILENKDEFFKKFLLKQALEALRQTVENTPTDTSLLKLSWQVGDQTVAIGSYVDDQGKTKYHNVSSAFTQNASVGSITKRGDTLEIDIFNNTEYASFVEYGHMDRGRKNWISGRFMCTLAIKDIQMKMPARLKREFAAWVRGLGES